MIVRPLTDDGLVGYDQFGQLLCTKHDKHGYTTWGIADVRTKTCVICSHGWEATGPAMADQYRWDLVEDYVHESCLVRHSGLIERAEFFRAICDARIRFRGLMLIPNGYWGTAPWGKKPWYSAELTEHPIALVLGWRKRVAHIEVKPQGGTRLDWYGAAMTAFEKEDVTKEFGENGVLLHAWGFDNVKRYIKVLAVVGGLAAKP